MSSKGVCPSPFITQSELRVQQGAHGHSPGLVTCLGRPATSLRPHYSRHASLATVTHPASLLTLVVLSPNFDTSFSPPSLPFLLHSCSSPFSLFFSSSRFSFSPPSFPPFAPHFRLPFSLFSSLLVLLHQFSVPSSPFFSIFSLIYTSSPFSLLHSFSPFISHPRPSFTPISLFCSSYTSLLFTVPSPLFPARCFLWPWFFHSLLRAVHLWSNVTQAPYFPQRRLSSVTQAAPVSDSPLAASPIPYKLLFLFIFFKGERNEILE